MSEQKNIVKLNNSYCSLYMKMKMYLAEKRLTRREFSRVCEDIFVMLYDAQQRGESADALFPDGPQAFCNDVAANCEREKWYEIALSILFWAVAVLTAVVLVNVLFTHFWPDEGEYINGVTARIKTAGIAGSVISSVVGAGVSFLYNKMSMLAKWKYFLGIAVLIAACIGASELIGFIVKASFATFNWVVLVCCTGAVTVAVSGLSHLISYLRSRKAK